MLSQLEELKSRDRQVWQKERENGNRTNYSAATKLILESPPVPMVTAQLINGVKECTCSCQTDRASVATNGTDNVPSETGSPVSMSVGYYGPEGWPYSNQRVHPFVHPSQIIFAETDFSNDDTNQLREQCRCAKYSSFWPWPLHDCRSRSQNTSILWI